MTESDKIDAEILKLIKHYVIKELPVTAEKLGWAHTPQPAPAPQPAPPTPVSPVITPPEPDPSFIVLLEKWFKSLVNYIKGN